jgi:hypothetical protein
MFNCCVLETILAAGWGEFWKRQEGSRASSEEAGYSLTMVSSLT